MKNYAAPLKARKLKIGVWGGGYIGFSTMAYFARQGVAGLVMDVNAKRVAAINRGEADIDGLQEWLGFKIAPLIKRGLIEAVSDPARVLTPEVLVHFVAIPTEKDGRPYTPYLEDVIGKIATLPKPASGTPPLVIIESTLTPGTTDKVVIPLLEARGKRVGKDVLLGVAPRRDWFVDGTKSLKDLDRVFGGQDPATAVAMKQVLSLVCDRLHQASSHRTAEMVKSFENAYRHMEITLANQLSLAYPDEDIREALQLVGTKWNIGTFYPGFGVGGYCIPLSSRYVLAGAKRPEELSILSDTIRTDDAINRLIARSLIARGAKKVGVLGLAYKANLKVSILSPTLPFLDELKKAGVEAKLCDPLFSDEEIRKIAGVEPFAYPNVGEFDAIAAVVDHAAFKKRAGDLFKNLGNCRFVLDNLGMWKNRAGDFAKRGIEYHVSGDAHWLGPVASAREAAVAA
ncbi:MAG TPA: nucleotide sugar dehydrogenase [Elusimicrobiota bacterium]|jgi:nucleotide sugar dehydrogenase|nr:nucleotide sugar dehydrogenase [Elusimicrobiota bacterium]